MNAAHLARVLNLVRTLSEHVVIADPESDDLFVLMHLDEYECLSGISSTPETNFSPHNNIEIPERPIPAHPASLAVATKKALPPTESLLSQKDTQTTVEITPPEQLDFNDAAWKNDWESAFLAEHPENISSLEIVEEEEEEKFYLEPLE